MFQIPSYAMFPGGNNNPVTVSTECGFGNYKSSFDNVLEYMSDGVCFYYTQEALNEDDDNTCAIVPRDENRPVLDFALFTVCNTDNKRTLSSLSAVSKSIHRLDESTVLVYPTIAWGKPCGINFAAGSFYRYNFRSQMLNFVVLWDQGLVKGSGAGPLFLGHNDDACCPSKRVVPLARVRNPPHTSGTVAAHFSGNYIATIFSTANFGLSVSAVSSETCPVDFIDGNSTGSLSRGEAEACVDLMRLFSIEIDSNMWQTEMALLVDADGASVTEVKASSDPVTHLCDSGEGVLVENVQVPDIQNDQGGYKIAEFNVSFANRADMSHLCLTQCRQTPGCHIVSFSPRPTVCNLYTANARFVHFSNFNNPAVSSLSGFLSGTDVPSTYWAAFCVPPAEPPLEAATPEVLSVGDVNFVACPDVGTLLTAGDDGTEYCTLTGCDETEFVQTPELNPFLQPKNGLCSTINGAGMKTAHGIESKRELSLASVTLDPEGDGDPLELLIENREDTEAL